MVFSNDGKTMYVVDYGEVYTNFQMPTPFYTVGEVRRDLDDHLYGRQLAVGPASFAQGATFSPLRGPRNSRGGTLTNDDDRLASWHIRL